jgi:serine/threonine protein kinase
MFAAPERQHGGKEYNPFLSDIYELGITLYNCATLSMPYRNPVSPSLEEWGGPRAKQLSPQVRKILRKATHPDPLKRYQSAAVLGSDIQRVTHVYLRPRRWPIVAGIIVAGLALGAYFTRDTIQEWAATLIPERAAESSQNEFNATDGSQQDLQAPPQDSSEVVSASVTDAEPEPPPVVEAHPPSLLVNVIPSNITRMDLNGDERTLGYHHEVDSGRQVVSIVHADYPVLTRRLTVSEAEEQVTYDLASAFTESKHAEILPVLIPPSDNHVLTLNLNGRKHTFENFPVLDFDLLEGTWELKAEVTDRTGTNRLMVVDSCVANPLGNGPRASFTGSEGRIVLRSGESGRVRLFVYWARR